MTGQGQAMTGQGQAMTGQGQAMTGQGQAMAGRCADRKERGQGVLLLNCWTATQIAGLVGGSEEYTQHAPAPVCVDRVR
jgi:hypothetical protein